MSNRPRPPNPAHLFCGELNEKVFHEAERRLHSGKEVSILLFGREISALAARLSGIGAHVVIDDAADHMAKLAGVRHVHLPLAALPDLGLFPEAPFDIILGQLAFHAQPYAATRQTLRHFLEHLKIGGKLCVSALGLHSDLGDEYPDSEKLVEQRFAELPPALASLYGLKSPVCLYSERNLITLLFEIGAAVVHSGTGSLGNVRAIGVRV